MEENSLSMGLFQKLFSGEEAHDLVIRNIAIVNPAVSGEPAVGDIFIHDGKIAAETEVAAGAGEIDGTGLVAFPGLVDMHVHLRDPGQTEKEDLTSGSKAAAAGGVTTLVAMPNTTPPIDTVEKYNDVTERSRKIGLVNVLQAGSITRGIKGQELSDMVQLMDAGCRAFSEDGKSVMDSGLLRDAMRLTAENQVPILAHCEDANLVRGVMNAGDRARDLGLPGITNAVENIIEYRDLELARETWAPLHLCHCSTAESYELVKAAKEKGVNVTAEVCPHHFILTEDEIRSADDANYKMNPPVRSRRDREALLKGLADGTFEVISTDHAPHTAAEKAKGFMESPFGIVGLETSFALSYTYLVKKGLITLPQLIEKMSVNPARILKIDRGDISVGKAADIAIADIDNPYTIDPNTFFSKGKNTPFGGREVYGKIMMTIHDGRVVFDREKDM